MVENAPADAFVAPQSPSAGTPSPQAMARLEAAVQKVSTREPAAAAPAPTAEKPRFGINSLIGRMTGQNDGGERPAAAPQPVRQQPPVQQFQEETAADPEQERIEIPAFLRRQAN
jgi:cell division protein FtsZ